MMLRMYCLEFERDWDDGVHMQMFAIREVVQESRFLSEALTRGKLSNSEILNDLPTYLSRLPEPQQRVDLIELIEFNKSLVAA